VNDWRNCRSAPPSAIVEEIERLRRQRWTGEQIAAETGVSPVTVSRFSVGWA
jgi:hypothetical protein